MFSHNQYQNNFKHRIMIVTFVVIICYLAYHAISGERGIISFFKLNHQLSILQEELEQSRIDRLSLEHHVSLMRSESIDLDMLDEQARKTLGYADEKEVIYFLDN